MPEFTPDQITFDRNDGLVDRKIYRVQLPADVGYDGYVRVTGMRHAADGTEQWIAEKLNALVPRLGINVLYGRLYSPMDLTD